MQFFGLDDMDEPVKLASSDGKQEVLEPFVVPELTELREYILAMLEEEEVES